MIHALAQPPYTFTYPPLTGDRRRNPWLLPHVKEAIYSSSEHAFRTTHHRKRLWELMCRPHKTHKFQKSHQGILHVSQWSWKRRWVDTYLYCSYDVNRRQIRKYWNHIIIRRRKRYISLKLQPGVSWVTWSTVFHVFEHLSLLIFSPCFCFYCFREAESKRNMDRQAACGSHALATRSTFI